MRETAWMTRLVGALLALGVVVAHVNDQGGVANFADPDWLGWGYRLIEVGGLLTAATLLLVGGWRPAWAPAALLGLAPFLGYIATRTVGLPGDSGDVGNWDDWGGTMALLFEASLFVLAISILVSRTRPAHRRPTAAEPSIA